MKRLALTLLAVLAMSMTMLAQTGMPVPVDPNVRVGKLDNGLTYLIRHNEKPAERANFYIAQKVGSILEEENQRGLAHFLEHMAFNGLKHFPKKAMLDYMERNGVKFGTNVNAWTSFEQTVYMLNNVPTTNPGLVDSCLLVLHDWSSFISLEDDEIESERGVILEEMRQGASAQMRIYDKVLPEIYPNSPYGSRMPIGTEEVVSGFEHQALRDYYHKWYRPDLQGIIVIGDIDVDQIEKRIIEMFADIPAPVNPAERVHFPVADNEEPIVSIATDVEETSYDISIFFKHDVTPDAQKSDISYWLGTLIENFISNMFNDRLQELTQKANPPFIYGYGDYGTFMISDTKDAWTIAAAAKDKDGIDEAMNAIVSESKRMKEFGFTESEYARAKADVLKAYERQFEERNKQETSRYFNEMLSHFLTNEPMMGIETEYQLVQQIIPNLPLEAINAYAKEMVTDNNIVIMLTAPQKEGEALPGKTELLEMFNKANSIEVEPYKETVSNEPLLAELPEPGKIARTELLKDFDATMLTMKNGVKVIYKPTDFKDDEILMSAYSFGGVSVMDESNPYILQEINSLVNLGGVGNFSAIDLPKVLAGKHVRVSPSISNYTEGINGSCSVKDLETMLQITYLYFNNMRSDDEAFQSYLTRTKAVLANAESDPMTTFSDSLNAVLYNNHPLTKRMKAEDYDKIDYAKAMKMAAERFADPNNFVFTFVGNIDPKTFEPLVAQYLGGMKAKKNNETWRDNGMSIVKGNHITHYHKAMENPKATCYMFYNGPMDYTRKNMMTMELLSDILSIVYTEKIREDEGGTYGVGVNGGLQQYPAGNFTMVIGFETNLEMYEKLMDIAKREVNLIGSEGPREQDLKKVKEYKIKKHAEDLDNNRYWMSCIQTQVRDGINMMAGYDELVNSITSEDIANMAKTVMKGYHKEVVQLPE
ncbi:MAG: insulinase family protein [Bacteroidales bacterium]|nr:insulinase family protein [Bacteroidales bacterium]